LKTRLSLSKEDAHQYDEDIMVVPEKEKLLPPPMYQVVLVNDDFSPMDFVIDVLETIFHMSKEKATQVMLTVHRQGKAVCGVYTKDIAETKCEQVNRYACENQHPLLCKIQKISDNNSID